MKRFAIAITLACALSSTALAGQIPTTDAPAPAPQQSSVVVTVILTILGVVVK
jgi:hypothetical protein